MVMRTIDTTYKCIYKIQDSSPVPVFDKMLKVSFQSYLKITTNLVTSKSKIYKSSKT